MQTFLNTLYVSSEPAYLRLDHDTVILEKKDMPDKTLPLLAFAGMVLFGDVMISPALIRRCADDGRNITFLDRNGRFRARVEGAVSGNVLLRQAQYAVVENPEKSRELARKFVIGKVQNQRKNFQRQLHENADAQKEKTLRQVIDYFEETLRKLPLAEDLDIIRGLEGDAAHKYFSNFHLLVSAEEEVFYIRERNRRPPLDPANALLSFLYTLLTHDCRSALETVGLDPQAGFLHTLRPGRPALALDLMEEFRPMLGDRMALTLLNRKQLTAGDFTSRPGGAVVFKDEARKKVIGAYVERKREEIQHPAFQQKTPIGLLPHIQAKILARVIRGELQEYSAYIFK